jgi:hypothetical protein
MPEKSAVWRKKGNWSDEVVVTDVTNILRCFGN